MMCRTKHVPKNIIAVVLYFVYICNPASAFCPSSCNCRWKKGKETVECRRKGLMFLPSNIEKGTQVLDLSENRFLHLQSGVFANANLVNLQKIFISSCNLKSIHPHALRQLNNLIELDLSHNALRKVPRDIFLHTSELQELYISGNPIQRIHNGDFDHTEGLKVLDISSCQIRYIELRSFRPLRFLHNLRLNGNSLQIFPSQLIFSLHQLHGIDLHNNPWACNCHLLPMRRWLSTTGHSQSPTCHSPERITGRLFSSLELSEFACPPKTLQTDQSIRTDSGSNVPFWCPVDGIPPPSVSWYHGDKLLHNSSFLGKSHVKINIFNSNANEQGSWLMLSGVTMSNAHLRIKCIASNPAGSASTAFVLNVSPSYKILMGLTFNQLLLTSAIMIVILMLACYLLFARWKTNLSRSPSKSDYVSNSIDDENPFPSAFVGEKLLIDDYSEISEDHPFDRLAPEDPIAPRSHSAMNFSTAKFNSSFSLHDSHKSLLPTSGSANILWEPEQAIAVLNSAAPENVIDKSYDSYPTCRSLISKRKSISTHRFTLSESPKKVENQFLYDNNRSSETAWCTLPRNNRPFIEQPIGNQSYRKKNAVDPSELDTVPSIFEKERRFSQPNHTGSELVVFSPSRSHAKPSMVTCSSHGKISSAIIHRDSPDEGFQEL